MEDINNIIKAYSDIIKISNNLFITPEERRKLSIKKILHKPLYVRIFNKLFK